ncbi:ribonuclease H-like domain-containing protein [Tanacetum coccineum]
MGPFCSSASVKTAKQLATKRNQERVKSILLLAILDEYLLKFHNVPNAKSLWEAIKSRFRGNDESKKMQRNVLKHQFENFTTAPNESLDKAYDRFQKLISQIEVYAAPVSKEDINQKFLRSLPPSWSQIALIMRNKPDIDQTDIDDLYNNLRVYEDEMKRSSSSTSNSQNLAFLSFENTSRTNEVSTASEDIGTTSPQLKNEDLQQIDEDDLEELDLRWQVAMLTVRVKKFIQKTGRNLDFKGKQPVSFDKSKIECYNCHRKGHFARECNSGRNQVKRPYGDNGRRNAPTNEPSSQALVAQDGLGGYNWSNDFDKPVNYALMAIPSSSSSSSSKNEVQNYSKQCLESFKTIQKNFDSEREKHNRAKLEIQGYELALESLESRILRHEKNELAWGEKYEFQNYELNQMSAKNKNGLGYGTQLDEMSNKSETDSEINMSVFEVRSSDEESTLANDRFSKADGYHAVPPPITGNFLTPRVDISFAGLDEYAIRKKIIESKTIKLKIDTSKSKTSETVGNTNEVNVEKPKSVNESVVSTPNVNRYKVIIEDWNSDDEDDVSAKKTACTIKTNKTQTVKTQVNKIGQISKKEGIGFKKIKACFVCKSTDHLIKDCDFYDKKSPEPKLKNVVNTSQRVVKPVWDNAKRVNHQIFSNKLKYPQTKRTFVPSGVQTRTGLVIPVRPNGKRAVHNVSTARSISTARPFTPKIAQTGSAIRPIYLRMDNIRPRASYSPIKRSYFTSPSSRPKDLKQDVQNITIARTRAVVDTGKGKMDNALRKSRWVWRPKGNYMDHESKENGSFMLKKFEYVDPKGNSKSMVTWVPKRHYFLLLFVQGNPKIFLQDHAVVDSDGDPKGGKITGKGKIRTANLDFDNVYFVDELKFNLFSVSQMCDKKNSVLFTDTECLIFSPSFKLLDESKIVLRAPRKDDEILASFEFKHIFKTVKGHLVRGLLLSFVIATLVLPARRVSNIRPPVRPSKPPSISFMRPFGCLLTILNTLDPLGKFDGKSDEGYLLGYSTTSKAFRVYNKRTKRVEENLHIDFLEYQPNVGGSGSSRKDKEPTQEYILLPLHPLRPRILVEDVIQDAQGKSSENAPNDKGVQDSEDITKNEEQHKLKEAEQALKDDLERMVAQEMTAKAMDDATRHAFEEEKRNIASQKKAAQAASINKLNTGRPSVNTANTPYVSAASTPIGANAEGSSFVYLGGQIPIDVSTLPNADLPSDPNMPDLEDDSDVFPNDGIFSGAYDDEDKDAEADFNNIDNTIDVSPIPHLECI